LGWITLFIHGSEGGHSDFAPTDERPIRLLHYLLPRFGHVEVERVCSEIGVPNIYEFNAMRKTILERPEVAQSIVSAKVIPRCLFGRDSDIVID